MLSLLRITTKLTNVMYAFAGVALTLMMLLTVVDVVLRYLGRPIPGSYELVSLCGAIVIGFAIPYTSLVRGHIFVEFLVDSMTKDRRAVVLTFTKILIFLLFVAFGVYLFKMGMGMAESGEVTQILEIPFYPVAYGMGVCCFIECLVMIIDIVKLYGGNHD